LKAQLHVNRQNCHAMFMVFSRSSLCPYGAAPSGSTAGGLLLFKTMEGLLAGI